MQSLKHRGLNQDRGQFRLGAQLQPHGRVGNSRLGMATHSPAAQSCLDHCACARDGSRVVLCRTLTVPCIHAPSIQKKPPGRGLLSALWERVRVFKISAYLEANCSPIIRCNWAICSCWDWTIARSSSCWDCSCSWRAAICASFATEASSSS